MSFILSIIMLVIFHNVSDSYGFSQKARVLMMPEQRRMDRVGLHMNQVEFSRYIDIASTIIAEFERKHRLPYGKTAGDIQKVPEEAGIELTSGGVTLNKEPQP